MICSGEAQAGTAGETTAQVKRTQFCRPHFHWRKERKAGTVPAFSNTEGLAGSGRCRG